MILNDADGEWLTVTPATPSTFITTSHQRSLINCRAMSHRTLKVASSWIWHRRCVGRQDPGRTARACRPVAVDPRVQPRCRTEARELDAGSSPGPTTTSKSSLGPRHRRRGGRRRESRTRVGEPGDRAGIVGRHRQQDAARGPRSRVAAGGGAARRRAAVRSGGGAVACR